jgi:histone deacetylase complex regulatory component SIN3
MFNEILKFAINTLNNLNERVLNENLQRIDLERDLGKSVIRDISRFYKEYAVQVLQGIEDHPKDTIPIVIKRFKKRMEEAQNQKIELDKTIKLSFDRFYVKSFDYRSFKFKNFDKKNNNAKAFIKEILTRKKEKLMSNNINILKGGVETVEFYTSMNLKYFKENISKIIKKSDDEILMKGLSE